MCLPTDEAIFNESINESNIAMRILRERRLNAGVHCWRALVVLDGVKDLRMKRNCLIGLAERFFNGLTFFDLSLFAVQSAIEIDESLSDPKSLAGDLLIYGNIQRDLGNTTSAIETFRKSLEMSIEIEAFANAASASTNLAVMLANNEKMDEALSLLYRSLSYLKKAPFPETETNTRLILINILYLKSIKPEEVIENAEVLFNRFSNKIPGHTKSLVSSALEKAIAKYLLDHPEIEPQLFRAQKFPLLNYWRSA